MPNDNAQAEIITDDDISEVPAIPEVVDGKEIDWKAEAEKYKGIADRRTTKLSKFKTAPKPEIPKPVDQTKKGELDFGQKAWLIAKGVEHEDDIKTVVDAMAATGKTLDKVMESSFLIGEIAKAKEERATKAAIPPADGRGSGADARDQVDYWLKKGPHELPPADQVDLRRKVVKARIAAAKTGNVFSSNPVVGSA